MRCVLTNFGTTGDVLPFVALALELRRYGHHCTLAVPGCFRRIVEQYGLEFSAVGPVGDSLQRQTNEALLSDTEIWNDPGRLTLLLQPLIDQLPDAISRLRSVCQVNRAELLVSGPAQPAARILHELIGIPWVSVHLSHFGGCGSPALRQASAALINPIRLQLGLPPLSDPLTIDANSELLALYAVSKTIMPRPHHWPEQQHVVGFFFMDEAGWSANPKLGSFVENGDRPVVVTFGSMLHKQENRVTEMLLAALSKAGCRGIFQQAGRGDDCESLTADIIACGYVPHGWLFPRASCIVHHGGAGTTGAALLSGRPSIFVPHSHAYDQPYWAHLAKDLGCSPEAIPFDQLDAVQLCNTIVHTLNTPSYRIKTEVVARSIANEDGVGRARGLIEQLASFSGVLEPADVLPEHECLKTQDRSIRTQRFYKSRCARLKSILSGN